MCIRDRLHRPRRDQGKLHRRPGAAVEQSARSEGDRQPGPVEDDPHDGHGQLRAVLPEPDVEHAAGVAGRLKTAWRRVKCASVSIANGSGTLPFAARWFGTPSWRLSSRSTIRAAPMFAIGDPRIDVMLANAGIHVTLAMDARVRGHDGERPGMFHAIERFGSLFPERRRQTSPAATLARLSRSSSRNDDDAHRASSANATLPTVVRIHLR